MNRMAHTNNARRATHALQFDKVHAPIHTE